MPVVIYFIHFQKLKLHISIVCGGELKLRPTSTNRYLVRYGEIMCDKCVYRLGFKEELKFLLSEPFSDICVHFDVLKDIKAKLKLYAFLT